MLHHKWPWLHQYCTCCVRLTSELMLHHKWPWLHPQYRTCCVRLTSELMLHHKWPWLHRLHRRASCGLLGERRDAPLGAAAQTRPLPRGRLLPHPRLGANDDTSHKELVPHRLSHRRRLRVVRVLEQLRLLSAPSRLHLGSLSAPSRLPLGALAAPSRLPLGALSAASRRPLGCLSAASRLSPASPSGSARVTSEWTTDARPDERTNERTAT